MLKGREASKMLLFLQLMEMMGQNFKVLITQHNLLLRYHHHLDEYLKFIKSFEVKYKSWRDKKKFFLKKFV